MSAKKACEILAQVMEGERVSQEAAHKDDAESKKIIVAWRRELVGLMIEFNSTIESMLTADR